MGEKRFHVSFVIYAYISKPFNIMVIQVYALTSNTEEAEVERFYEDLKDFLELTLKKMSFSLKGTGMQK